MRVVQGDFGFWFCFGGEEGSLEKTGASAIYTRTYTHTPRTDRARERRERREGAMLGGTRRAKKEEEKKESSKGKKDSDEGSVVDDAHNAASELIRSRSLMP